jgi:hypothetical protein
LEAALSEAGEPGPKEQVKREIVRKTEPIAPHRRPTKEEARDKGYNVILKEKGNSAQYLTARLKRDAPDIAERLERGEFKSVRQAAIEVAGAGSKRDSCNSCNFSLYIPSSIRVTCAHTIRVIRGEIAGIAGIPFSLSKRVAPGGFVRAQS